MIVNNQLFDMSLRQNFDSFTSEHKLRDAEEEYVQAAYKFREAEHADVPNLICLKREMEDLGRKLEFYRQCIYSGQTIEGYAEWSELPDRCPEPAWA